MLKPSVIRSLLSVKHSLTGSANGTRAQGYHPERVVMVILFYKSRNFQLGPTTDMAEPWL